MKTKIIVTVLLLASIDLGFSQGFVNLDFESANVLGNSAGSVPASNAIGQVFCSGGSKR